MRAIQFARFGDYHELNLVDLPQPYPDNSEVLVRMTAAVVTPLDDRVRRGRFPRTKQPPLIPGIEGVGRVEGTGSPELPSGTRVIATLGAVGYGVTADGTWREYLVAHPEHLIPLPGSLSDEEIAGALQEHLPAQLALTLAGSPVSGQTILLPAVGAGVGDAAARLALIQGAARVILWTRSTSQAIQVRAAGYVDVLDLSCEQLGNGIARLTEDAGVDMVIDNAGGSMTSMALKSLRPGGTLLSLGYPEGRETCIDLACLNEHQLRLLGVDLLRLPYHVVRVALDTVLQYLVDGQIQPRIARCFLLAEAAEAQRYVIEKRPFGRVVLTI